MLEILSIAFLILTDVAGSDCTILSYEFNLDIQIQVLFDHTCYAFTCR